MALPLGAGNQFGYFGSAVLHGYHQSLFSVSFLSYGNSAQVMVSPGTI